MLLLVISLVLLLSLAWTRVPVLVEHACTASNKLTCFHMFEREAQLWLEEPDLIPNLETSKWGISSGCAC